jgi:hypothetical protein
MDVEWLISRLDLNNLWVYWFVIEWNSSIFDSSSNLMYCGVDDWDLLLDMLDLLDCRRIDLWLSDSDGLDCGLYGLYNGLYLWLGYGYCLVSGLGYGYCLVSGLCSYIADGMWSHCYLT